MPRSTAIINYTFILLAALCLPSIAAKPPKPLPLQPPIPFFKTTGEPFELEKPFPGITAALMLTDQQKTALSQAHQQTVRNPDLRNKISALELKADSTQAQRETVRREMKEARAQLRQRVAAILTPEQSTLASKIQDAAIAAEHEANDIFRADFEAAKADPRKSSEVREKSRVEAEDLLVQKLEKFLTPAQMQAIQQSATDLRAAEGPARKPKAPN
ncbi:MAG TPA: hypothetical protein VGQ99_02310 [Tepidisphaeraceae bacterium]|jgi:hypothetical protein|nr:hypothetical protein [Tepidisphaeraceae bacterium]